MKKITIVVFLLCMGLFSYQLSAQIISEDFESGLGTYENATGNNVDWAVNTTLFKSGAQSISNAYGGSNNNAVFLTTPVDLTGATNPQLSFWHIAKLEGGWDEAIVEISTDGGTTWNAFLAEDYQGAGVLEGPGIFDEDSYPLWETTNVTPVNTWWKREFFDLSDYMTDSVVIRFRLDSDSSVNRTGWFLDDVEIIEVVCPMPSAIIAENVGPNSANISWTAGATETEWEILYGLAGFDPETEGTSVIDNDGTLGETISSLTAVETYDVYVKAICSPTEESVWVGPYTFNTACDIISLPWSEDFASATTPLCWEETGDNSWDYSLNADYAAEDVLDHTAGGGTNYAWMDGSDNSNGETSTLTSPLIDISSLTEPALEFFLFSNNTNDGAINIIDVEFFDGNDWNSILSVNTLLGTSWNQYVIDLAPYTITGAVQVRFTVTGNDNGGSAYHNDILLDDVTFLEMPDCANPIATYEVVGNCIAGPEFFVEVDITNMSGTDDIILSDNQTPAETQTATATGVYQFGPYPNGTDVVITLENSVDANCSATSPSLTQEFCTETYLDCTNDGPFNVVYCYDSGEDYEITYISTDGTTPLNLNVNSGKVENNFDEFIVLDSDGVTELYNGYGNVGDLTGLSFQSTGAEITVRITPDGSVSCQSSNNITPIDYTVSCATCVNPQVNFDVVADCDSGPQFIIEVEVTDLGSATDLLLSDGDTANDQSVNATGTYTFGPYANGDLINISVLNEDDINCEINSGDLTQEYCSALNVDCSDGPVNSSFCYGNNETNEIVYTSTDGSVLNLTITAGQMSTFGDDFIILDSNGTTQLYSGTGNNGNLAGLTFQSTGDNITIRLISNGFTSCETNGYTPIDLTVECATCINPQVTYFKDCDPGNQEYSIDVEVTDLGSAGSIEISDDQGSAPQTLTTVGIVTFGPFDYATDVVITTENLDDASCTIVSAPINSDACPPIPCLEAEPFCSDEGLLFANVDDSSGTTAPPGIDYGCLGTQPNPVWYFLQIEDAGDLAIEMVQNTSFDEDGNPTGTGLDIDFIAWGPFDDVDSACNGLTVQNQVPDSAIGDGCSYSAQPVETFGIENAQEGDVYVLLITNYNGAPGFITLNQVDGSGSTDCSIIDENTTYACGDDPVTLTSQYPTALAYVWYIQDANGDYVMIEGEDTMNLTVTEGGIYRLDTFNNAGELQQEIFTLIYSEEPDLSNVADTVSFCGTTSTTLDATIGNPGAFDAVTYQWSDEDGILTGETQPTLTVTEAGLYTVEVSGVILDEDGDPTSQTCETSKVIEVTTADFTVDAGVDQSACDAEDVMLTAGVAGADTANATYDWVNSSGDTVGNTETITVNQADVYTVTVTIDGCVASDDVEVTFTNTPSIDLGSDLSTCDIGGIVIDATPAMGVTGVTFEWTFNGTSIPETGAIVNAADYGFGVYEVKAYTSASCSVTKSITISEADYTVNLSANQELVETVLNYCEGEESVPSYAITFTANIEGIDASLLSYAWYKNGTLISDAADEPTYTANYTEDVNAMDTYSVEVSLDSCVVTSEVLGVDLTIAPYEGGCIISEGLSPGNPDGINDCLDLSFLSDRTGIKKIQIFSRYGRVVYEKSNYVNEWCGQNKDSDFLETATYFYVIEFTSEDPVFGNVKKGWIYLNREPNN